ncbi:hypothetical protein KEM54_002623 [Ascosphaera aggregata]|nr:hypothetical protein KEM54_002623 [Ascosphaera aggregata]
MVAESRGVTGNVSGTPFAIDTDDESILGHDDIYDNDNDGNVKTRSMPETGTECPSTNSCLIAIEADDPLHDTDRTPLTSTIPRDREDDTAQRPSGRSGSGNSGNIASNISTNYLTSHIPGEDRRAPLNTIDETVWETLSRDMLASWEKMRQVLWPRYLLGGMLTARGGGIGATERGESQRPGVFEGFGNGFGAGVRGLMGRWPDANTVLQGGMSEGLRNWDLWGPLVFCLLLSMFLAVHHHGEQASLVFSGTFCIVWIGEAVVTVQIKLLGGNISFFQSVSIIGYTLFPLVIAAALSAVGIPSVVRIPVYLVLIAWALAAGISILGGSGVVQNRSSINMLHKVTVVANTASSYTAPGWAYVPDTSGPPRAHAPVRGTRKGKRTFRESTGAGAGGGGGDILAGIAKGRGNLTARQNTAMHRRLAELDRENHRDVHIPIVTTKGKELAAKSSRSKTTTNVRRILMSQKTFKNFLDDEEASLAHQQNQAAVSSSSSRPSNRPSAVILPPVPAGVPPAVQYTPKHPASQSLFIVPQDSDHLLRVEAPSPPPEHVMEQFLSEPPLSYNAARAVLDDADDRPVRYFCGICGYWGRIKCFTPDKAAVAQVVRA